MNRCMLYLASAVFAFALLAPGVAGAQAPPTYYCDECHIYGGNVATMDYYGTTEVSGQQVGISGQAVSTQSIYEGYNAGLVTSFNNEYPNFGQVHALGIGFDNGFVGLYNDSEQNIAGTFITDGKKFAGNSPMVGFITTAGDVWIDGFSEELFFGFPQLYLNGYGTILYFKGSAEYVGKIKYGNEGDETVTLKLNLQPGSSGLVDVSDGEIQWDTWRAAPVRLTLPVMTYYLEYIGD